jgi:hypothetical protein
LTNAAAAPVMLNIMVVAARGESRREFDYCANAYSTTQRGTPARAQDSKTGVVRRAHVIVHEPMKDHTHNNIARLCVVPVCHSSVSCQLR